MLAIIRCRIFCLPVCYLNIKIYRTVILPVVLYGCETWLLTLKEERRLRVFENRVLRRIFGPRRDEVKGEAPLPGTHCSFSSESRVPFEGSS